MIGVIFSQVLKNILKLPFVYSQVFVEHVLILETLALITVSYCSFVDGETFPRDAQVYLIVGIKD